MKKEYMGDAGDVFKRFVFQNMKESGKFHPDAVFMCMNEEWNEEDKSSYQNAIGLTGVKLIAQHPRNFNKDFKSGVSGRFRFVFLDPNTGLHLTKNAERYVTPRDFENNLLDEVELVLSYQHDRRTDDIELFVQQVAEKVAFSSCSNGERVFCAIFGKRNYFIAAFSKNKCVVDAWEGIFSSPYDRHLLRPSY